MNTSEMLYQVNQEREGIISDWMSNHQAQGHEPKKIIAMEPFDTPAAKCSCGRNLVLILGWKVTWVER